MLTLKTPWHDGTTHLVMSPLKFMQRLAAFVPCPRLHLIRFHGVLAPNAKLRAQVILSGKESEGAARPVSEPEPDEPHDPHCWGRASVGHGCSSVWSKST